MRALALLPLLVPATAAAGPWTRDQGHFYVNLNDSRITSRSFFQLGGTGQQFGATYTQHVLGHYAEVGLLSRWLTASVEWQVYRNSSLVNPDPASGFRATADGVGTLRFGLWSGLITNLVRFTVAVIAGFPLGDPRPRATEAEEAGCAQQPTSLACDAVAAARSLPTGDGEFDLEARASLGYSFGAGATGRCSTTSWRSWATGGGRRAGSRRCRCSRGRRPTGRSWGSSSRGSSSTGSGSSAASRGWSRS